MKGYRLKLISSDSIRVQIQKEEIDKIIKLQQNKESKVNVDLNSPSQSTRKLGLAKRHVSTFSVRNRKKKLQQLQCKNQYSETNFKKGLKDQITYFSVKNHYERVINSTEDWILMSQLQSQLRPSQSYRYWSERSPKSGNFFERVQSKPANKVNKVRKLVQQQKKQHKIYYRYYKHNESKSYLVQFL